MSREVCGICWCPYDEETGACGCEPALKEHDMTTLRTAAQQALEALENPWAVGPEGVANAITTLRAALAKPEPFNPDWDRIAPLQENLREHMAEIQKLRAQRDALLEALRGLLALDKEHHQRGHDDEDICQEVQAAYAAIKNAEGEKT